MTAKFLPYNIAINKTARGCSVIGTGYKGTFILEDIINKKLPRITEIKQNNSFIL